VVVGSLPGGLNLRFHPVFMTVAVTGLLTEREKFQRAIAIVASVSIPGYVALPFAVLR